MLRRRLSAGRLALAPRRAVSLTGGGLRGLHLRHARRLLGRKVLLHAGQQPLES